MTHVKPKGLYTEVLMQLIKLPWDCERHCRNFIIMENGGNVYEQQWISCVFYILVLSGGVPCQFAAGLSFNFVNLLKRKTT